VGELPRNSQLIARVERELARRFPELRYSPERTWTLLASPLLVTVLSSPFSDVAVGDRGTVEVVAEPGTSRAVCYVKLDNGAIHIFRVGELEVIGTEDRKSKVRTPLGSRVAVR
jgi:hypothetical protein